MKASTVIKLLLVLYLPISAYYSAVNSFEETSIDAEVSAFFPSYDAVDTTRTEQGNLHQQQLRVYGFVE